MVTKRQAVLLKKMIGTNHYVPIRHYAKILDVSERTVHSDIKRLEDIAEKFCCRIIKTPNKGVKFKGSKEQKQKLLNYLDQSHGMDLTPAERQIKILKCLIDGQKLSYNRLSEAFCVSRSSIASDFKRIKELCEKVKAQLKFDNSGTYLVGSESQIQSLMSKYYLKKFQLEYNRYPASLEEYHRFLSTLNEKIDKTIISTTFQIISDLTEKYQLANHYSINLYNTLSILCMRAQQGKHIETPGGSVIETLRELETYYIAGEIAEKILRKLSIQLLDEDIIFLNKIIIANGITPTSWSFDQHQYYQPVQNLIDRFSDIVNIDLRNDKKLFTGLMNHIVPMIYRINHGIYIKNPLLEEIKRQYSLTFNITWFVVLDFEKEIGVQIPEDEIGFLLVHFQSALERNSDIKKILLVCPNGIVTSELLENRLRQYLPGTYVYEITSSNDIGSYNLQVFDFIITTVPIEGIMNGKEKIFYLPPIPTDKELIQLSRFLSSSFDSESTLGKIKPLETHFGIINVLDLDLINVDQSLDSMYVILDFLLRQLENRNLVDPQYRESLFNREKLSSTALDTGIAIPHGNPEFIRETKLSIFVNQKKILWGNERVDVVLLLSISKKDKGLIGPILSQISDLISDRKKVERIFLHKSRKEIYEYFLLQSHNEGKCLC